MITIIGIADRVPRLVYDVEGNLLNQYGNISLYNILGDKLDDFNGKLINIDIQEI